MMAIWIMIEELSRSDAASAAAQRLTTVNTIDRNH